MDTSTSFSSLDNLSPSDRRLFNLFGRGEAANPPHSIVHHAFEAIASAHPDAVAVRQHDGATITYGELDRRANILANHLRTSHGLSKGDRVVLVISRSIEMVVSILAVLKAGGQYVPVDGGVVPLETLAYQITDSGASIVLCLPKHKTKVQQSVQVVSAQKSADAGVAIVGVECDSPLWTSDDQNARNPSIDVHPQDGAYVIYTSGTTGKPKGVDVAHSNVTHTLLIEPAKLGITVGKQVAQQLNVAFDMCAWEILATLMNGGTLCTRGSGDDNWVDCLRHVDIVISTPTIALSRFPRQEEFPNLKTIVVGGEPCPKALADHWAPHVNFYNICGPTEITILNTAHLHRQGVPLTIGKPNPGTTLYILDEDENPVPIGQPGVMWVGGAGVSRGYLNLPELTAKRYKLDKFANNGCTMFDTGDIGRWLPDGTVETQGRKDDQVKINGFRVELDGVSRAIETHPGVIKGCALMIDGKLWGFYSAPAEIPSQDLKLSVGIHQPYYAIPVVWRHILPVPLTPNGKIDKRLLLKIATGPTTSSSSINSRSESDFTEKESVSSSHSQTQIDDEKMPEPKGSIFSYWHWLSAYRKLFTIIMVSNLTALIIMLWQYRNTPLPLSSLATAVSANLLASVLLRLDYFVNVIFWLATRFPTSTPFFIRRHLAHIYHYGGVHSGCSVGASLWWLVFTIAATTREAPRFNTAILVLTYLILSLLLAILAMAYPTIRAKLHDQFEWTHRFAGWTALALVWAHLIIVVASQTPLSQPLSPQLARTPALYLLALTTLSIASPWLRLRKVRVTAELLSNHAIRLHFPDFSTPRPCSSVAIRITDRPLVEWHAFAAFPDPEGITPGFSIIVSKAGDWTSHIIENPPTKIWTRGIPASGVLAIAPLFKKIVLVSTGSGIGPCLPVIMERKVPCRILWSTKNPVRTYGQRIVDEVRRADQEAVVWDTQERGRPDLVKLAWGLWRESGAECVCVISNSKVTSMVVRELEARGVPAFGPIWDS